MVEGHQIYSHCRATISPAHLQNCFHLSKLNSVRIKQTHPIPSTSSPLATTIVLTFSVSMDWTILNISCKQNHTTFIVSRLAYFTECNVRKVVPCCSMCQNFLPL